MENVKMLLHERDHATSLRRNWATKSRPMQSVAEPRIRAEPWEVTAATLHAPGPLSLQRPLRRACDQQRRRLQPLAGDRPHPLARRHDAGRLGRGSTCTDDDAQELWSPTSQPVANRDETHTVHFAPDSVGFISRHESIAARLDIYGSAPEHDVEIRRVRLTNQGDTPPDSRCAATPKWCWPTSALTGAIRRSTRCSSKASMWPMRARWSFGGVNGPAKRRLSSPHGLVVARAHLPAHSKQRRLSSETTGPCTRPLVGEVTDLAPRPATILICAPRRATILI
ncbi:MAG: hypothetical protein R2854_20530 [Caldilineaceae bacterium]